jgi:hypothetical protein
MCPGLSTVMPGPSRPKDGVASLAYGAGHPRLGGVALATMIAIHYRFRLSGRVFTPGQFLLD